MNLFRNMLTRTYRIMAMPAFVMGTKSLSSVCPSGVRAQQSSQKLF
jgi:hypothetical protein